jgi:hypothetical protein
MKKTAVKLVAVLVTALLALTGCAKTNPNVAATAGAATISVTQVDEMAKIIAAKSSSAQSWGSLRAAVLEAMVQAKISKQAQTSAGITITDINRQQVYEVYPGLETLAKDPATSSFALDIVDNLLLTSFTAGKAAWTEAIAVVPVTVNPAFGQWDAASAKLTGTTGSLSSLLS